MLQKLYADRRRILEQIQLCRQWQGTESKRCRLHCFLWNGILELELGERGYVDIELGWTECGSGDDIVVGDTNLPDLCRLLHNELDDN